MFRMVLFDLGVGVPPASRPRIQFNKSNTPLHKSPCEQAVFSKRLCPFVHQTIGHLSRLGFLGQIDRFGGVRLHLKRQFIGRDPGFEFAVATPMGEMVPVQLIDVIELPSLTLVADLCRRVQMQDRILAGKELGSLVSSRHKS